jgi:uncharacterized protein YndB with AHSA1/START domain
MADAMSRSTTVRRIIRAPREKVYAAFLNAESVAAWMVPTGMTSEVHLFEGREGGRFRVSLTYKSPMAVGKTTEHTDTYHGRFVRLLPDREIVESIEFETDHPAMQGEMTMTITLSDVEAGTELVAVHDGLPPGVSAADNELGWKESLEKLASLVEDA